MIIHYTIMIITLHHNNDNNTNDGLMQKKERKHFLLQKGRTSKSKAVPLHAMAAHGGERRYSSYS
jgi:hypothetical protein